ncbi:MAG: hypothetical protein CVT99_05465 [Bacteroidetes bacterium HGW-Bacteroidetes-16]|jgi:hypothetical protein|nr:MAG: hypothetical protein CVT99_05465 [Bacteroidetes bacterium HGW-Bacteroidetes-16]
MTPGVFKRDCVMIGVLMGILFPFLLLGILFGLNWILQSLFGLHFARHIHYLYLLSMTANLFPLRYYLAKLNYEKTGMGLLLMTIAGVIGYFYAFGIGG